MMAYGQMVNMVFGQKCTVAGVRTEAFSNLRFWVAALASVWDSRGLATPMFSLDNTLGPRRSRALGDYSGCLAGCAASSPPPAAPPSGGEVGHNRASGDAGRGAACEASATPRPGSRGSPRGLLYSDRPIPHTSGPGNGSGSSRMDSADDQQNSMCLSFRLRTRSEPLAAPRCVRTGQRLVASDRQTCTREGAQP